jgi:quercetin dioxygenase-like cupin family protein
MAFGVVTPFIAHRPTSAWRQPGLDNRRPTPTIYATTPVHRVWRDRPMPATVFQDLVAEAPIPARGILSRTLSKEAGVELVLFAFAEGEQLSEHTSVRPAIIHVLAGEADLVVGDAAYQATPGTWARMPSNTKHSLLARTPLVMALYLLPREAI